MWPGERYIRQSKRRLFPILALGNEPLNSEHDLNHNLELLDSIGPGGELTTSPFGVFSPQATHASLRGVIS
jgi:hypothetical protein